MITMFANAGQFFGQIMQLLPSDLVWFVSLGFLTFILVLVIRNIT